MFDDDVEDEKLFVMESARKNKRGSKEEIELYEELSLALELKQDDTFRVEGSRICNGIDFSIVTPYPDGLPFNVSSMFFNLSTNYDVQIKETPLLTKGIYRDPGEMNFQIKIKKL